MTEIERLETDLNGYGKALTDVRIQVGQHATRIDRTEFDVQEAWKAVDSIRLDVNSVKDSVGKITAKVAWIVGGISATSLVLMLILQFVLGKL